MELGWGEVAGGLGRIVFGYFLGSFGVATGLFLLILSFTGVPLKVFNKGDVIAIELTFTAGLIILGASFLGSYYYIWSGKFRCMLHAPERYGTRWLMFGTLLCLTVSPVLEIAVGFTGDGYANYAALKRGEALNNLFNMMAILQIFGLVAGLLATILFVLFLRAIALCFDSQMCLLAIYTYLFFNVLLIA